MAESSAGRVALKLTLNTDGIQAAVSDVAKDVNGKLSRAFDATAQTCESKMQSLSSNVKSSVDTAVSGVETLADTARAQIEQIIADTERSEKSKAASIATIYKKQGADSSTAFKRAWEDIGKSSKNVNSEQVKSSKKAWQGITQSSKNSTEKIKKNFDGVSQKAQQSSEKMKNSISGACKKIGTAVAAAFSVAAVKSFTSACIESAAEVNAANSQFEQTFGELQSQAEEAMSSVAEESGIVESRLQSVGTSIYAFAKTTGMDSANAMSMMEDALQVTADSAAYYDRSLEDTAESLKSFLKGNYENDAALGLSCTETTRNTAANKLYGKSFSELSESQKQLTLLQMVKDANELSGAMGQAAREADGWENVTGNLKESWNQFLAVVGQPVLQVATTVVKKMSSALSTLTEYAKGAVNSLAELFGWDLSSSTASNISEAADSAEDLTDTAEESSEAVDDITDSSEEAKNSLAGFDKLNVLSSPDSSSSDSGTTSEDTTASSASASDATAAVSSVESAVYSLNDKLTGTFKNLYEKSGFKSFVSNIQKGINKVDWSKIGENCKTIFNNAVPIAQKAFEQMQKVGAAKLGAIGSAIGAVATIGGEALTTLSVGVAKWITKDKTKIIGFIDAIGTNLTTGYNNLSSFFDKFGTLAGTAIENVRPQMETSIATLLSGFTTFAGSVGTVLSGAFATASESLNTWIDKDSPTITEFLENLQLQVGDVFTFFGNVFGDIGTILNDRWSTDGQPIFQNVCDMFTNIGTTL